MKTFFLPRFSFWYFLSISALLLTFQGVFALNTVFAQTSLTSANGDSCQTLERKIIKDTTKPSLTRFGAGFEAGLPFVNAQFSGLPNVPTCCTNYRFLQGLMLGGWLSAEFGLGNQVAVGTRLGFMQSSVSFFQREYKPFIFAQNLIPLYYSLSADIFSLTLEPYLVYRPIDMLSVQLGIGLGTGLGGRFSQSERIDTSGVTFDNLSKTRNQISGNISDAAPLLPSLRIGLVYDFPLNAAGTFLLSPEISFVAGFGDVVRNLQGDNPMWSQSSIRAGLALRYSPERATKMTSGEIAAQQEKEDARYNALKEECRKKTVAAQPVKRLKILNPSAKAINTDNSESDAPKIMVEDFLASRSRYILNSVFFAENSGLLPQKYITISETERQTFRLESLSEAGVLQIYYQVLNIIGKRLLQFPKADITLLGHADGLNEKNDRKLAQMRAEVLKNYLVGIWGIAENRIKIQIGVSRVPQPNDGDELLEAEEQRRVDIQTNTKAVLEELRFDYTLQTISPQKIRFAANVDHAEASSKLMLRGIQEQVASKRQLLFEGKAILKASPEADSSLLGLFDWEVAASVSRIASANPIDVVLKAESAILQQADSISLQIPVEYKSVKTKAESGLADKRIDSYTLFSFAYGTNAPISGNADVQRVVASIKQTLKSGAKVIVTGYTDTRGNEITNGILATQRANAVAGLINVPNMQINSVPGATINDNSLPEGRFYNRFVQVDVQTPVR